MRLKEWQRQVSHLSERLEYEVVKFMDEMEG